MATSGKPEQVGVGDVGGGVLPRESRGERGWGAEAWGLPAGWLASGTEHALHRRGHVGEHGGRNDVRAPRSWATASSAQPLGAPTECSPGAWVLQHCLACSRPPPCLPQRPRPSSDATVAPCPIQPAAAAPAQHPLVRSRRGAAFPQPVWKQPQDGPEGPQTPAQRLAAPPAARRSCLEGTPPPRGSALGPQTATGTSACRTLGRLAHGEHFPASGATKLAPSHLPAGKHHPRPPGTGRCAHPPRPASRLRPPEGCPPPRGHRGMSPGCSVRPRRPQSSRERQLPSVPGAPLPGARSHPRGTGKRRTRINHESHLLRWQDQRPRCHDTGSMRTSGRKKETRKRHGSKNSPGHRCSRALGLHRRGMGLGQELHTPQPGLPTDPTVSQSPSRASFLGGGAD